MLCWFSKRRFLPLEFMKLIKISSLVHCIPWIPLETCHFLRLWQWDQLGRGGSVWDRWHGWGNNPSSQETEGQGALFWQVLFSFFLHVLHASFTLCSEVRANFVYYCMVTSESWPEQHWLSTWGKDGSALGSQVKAIHLCNQKGWSLAAPLLDLI